MLVLLVATMHCSSSFIPSRPSLHPLFQISKMESPHKSQNELRPPIHITSLSKAVTSSPRKPFPRKMRQKIILPVFLSILTCLRPVSTNAMGPNLRGPIIEKEIRGMDMAKIMARDIARNEFNAERLRIDAESSRIYNEEGPEAQAAFLKKVKIEQAEKSAQKKNDRNELIERLIFEEGLDPWKSIKGKAVLFEFDTGVDLYQVDGTEQEVMTNLKKMFPEKDYEEYEKKDRLSMLKEVEDMMDRGKTKEEIVTFFREEGEKYDKMMSSETGRETRKLQEIRDARKKKAQERLEKKKDANQIAGTVKPEASEPEAELALERLPQSETEVEAEREIPIGTKESQKVIKEKALEKEKRIQEKALEKEKRIQEKALQREKRMEEKASKQNAKAEAKALKLKLTAEKKAKEQESKAAAAAAATAAASTAASLEATVPNLDLSDQMEGLTSEESTSVLQNESELSSETQFDSAQSQKSEVSAPTRSKFESVDKRVIAGSLVIGSSGLYVVQGMRNKGKKQKLEREAQFRVLMGLDEDEPKKPARTSSSPSKDSKAKKLDPEGASVVSESPKQADAQVATPKRAEKKKRGGIASIFTKSKSNRPSSLQKLLVSDAPECQFMEKLSQVLASSAPGSFPDIVSTVSNNQTECINSLVEEKKNSGLSAEQTAEAFANVVNCMLIPIIDLASENMKKEEDKVIIGRVNAVLDFMEFSAPIYDAVAEGYTIKPVTYGGSLSKSKREELFSTYASTSMMNLEASAEDRVDMLQFVLNIPDKRAEGVLQKKMTKNLMNMMKDGGKGGDGDFGDMAKMFADGMPGMPGMPGADPNAEISPEELKQTVKIMKELLDSGNISKEEIKLVKEQFKQEYGGSVEDLMKMADSENVGDELGEDGKELLDLFKTVLKDDD